MGDALMGTNWTPELMSRKIKELRMMQKVYEIRQFLAEEKAKSALFERWIYGETRGKDDYIQDPNTGQMRGRMPSNKSGLTGNGENDTIPIRDCAKINQLSEIDDNAAHKLVKGFEEPELTEHWEGSPRANSHKGQYKGMTKAEYGKRARELAESPTSKYIRGFACLNQDIIVRYDVRTNDFVKAHIHNGVITMFKPSNKTVYYSNEYRKEMRNRPRKKKRK